MRIFYHLLVNSLLGGMTTNFVWSAVTYWAYLGTKSVLTTSIISGIYLTANALSAIWFGSLVDHSKKRTAMLVSSSISLLTIISAFIVYSLTPQSNFTHLENPLFWLMVILILLGVVVGNIRGIAIPILIAMIIPAEQRDKANGMSGTTTGIAFAITSVFSGIALAFAGMGWVLLISIFITLLTIIHLLFIRFPETQTTNDSTVENNDKIDIKGTIKVILGIPGLIGLILFATLNNLLGGVFMSLMDAYGLSLVPLQTWGILWGFLSLGFIVGGLLVARLGLGSNPLRTLFLSNLAMWVACIFFTIQPSIVLLMVGCLIWICLVPFAEASEQTIFQKVVPIERLGRVLGFAQTVETAASPVTAFMIGPVTQFVFIPFMTTGIGVELLGTWFGIGHARGIALVFTVAGMLGTAITLAAMRTRSYRALGDYYKK